MGILLARVTRHMCSGGSRGGARGTCLPQLPLILGKKEEITEGKMAGIIWKLMKQKEKKNRFGELSTEETQEVTDNAVPVKSNKKAS